VCAGPPDTPACVCAGPPDTPACVCAGPPDTPAFVCAGPPDTPACVCASMDYACHQRRARPPSAMSAATTMRRDHQAPRPPCAATTMRRDHHAPRPPGAATTMRRDHHAPRPPCAALASAVSKVHVSRRRRGYLKGRLHRLLEEGADGAGRAVSRDGPGAGCRGGSRPPSTPRGGLRLHGPGQSGPRQRTRAPAGGSELRHEDDCRTARLGQESAAGVRTWERGGAWNPRHASLVQGTDTDTDQTGHRGAEGQTSRVAGLSVLRPSTARAVARRQPGVST
jgi:hypothetical protein